MKINIEKVISIKKLDQKTRSLDTSVKKLDGNDHIFGKKKWSRTIKVIK
jgi:hypothetical protein